MEEELNNKVEEYFKLAYRDLTDEKDIEIKKKFIRENIDRIDENLKNKTNNVKVAIKFAKVDKYKFLLHNDAEFKANNNKFMGMPFIINYIDEIDENYNLFLQEGLTEYEAIKKAYTETKVNFYFKKAYEDLSNEEKIKNVDIKKKFIRENIDRIDAIYGRDIARYHYDGDLDKFNLEKEIIYKFKVQYYKELAYGDLSDVEMYYNGHKNTQFIRKHLDEIENYYEDSIKNYNDEQINDSLKKQIVKDAIKNIEKNNINMSNALENALKDKNTLDGVKNNLDNNDLDNNNLDERGEGVSIDD